MSQFYNMGYGRWNGWNGLVFVWGLDLSLISIRLWVWQNCLVPGVGGDDGDRNDN